MAFFVLPWLALLRERSVGEVGEVGEVYMHTRIEREGKNHYS